MFPHGHTGETKWFLKERGSECQLDYKEGYLFQRLSLDLLVTAEITEAIHQTRIIQQLKVAVTEVVQDRVPGGSQGRAKELHIRLEDRQSGQRGYANDLRG